MKVFGAVLLAVFSLSSGAGMRGQECRGFFWKRASIEDIAMIENPERICHRQFLFFKWWKPLVHMAVEHATDSTFQTFLERRGPDVNRLDAREYSPLMRASARGRADVARMLVRSGAQLDLQSYGFQNTALMLALKNGHPRVAGVLLGAGADVDRQNGSKWTALMMAVRIGDVALVEAVARASSRIDSQNSEGNTALIMAVKRGDRPAAAVLREPGGRPGFVQQQGLDGPGTGPRKGLRLLGAALGSVRRRLLVTTKLKESWNRERPILFLGSWCVHFSEEAEWKNLDYEIREPSNVDIVQRFKDVAYCQKAEGRLFDELFPILNDYHGASHGRRFWAILLRHWLHSFAPSMFARHQSLEKLAETGERLDTVGLDIEPACLARDTTAGFSSALECDLWNHKIYLEMLKAMDGPSVAIHPKSCAMPPPAAEAAASPATSFLKSLVKKWVFGRVFPALARKTDAVVLNSYLPRLEEAKLQLRLGQVPQLWQSPPRPPGPFRPRKGGPGKPLFERGRRLRPRFKAPGFSRFAQGFP